jgi:hypothetical protein
MSPRSLTAVTQEDHRRRVRPRTPTKGKDVALSVTPPARFLQKKGANSGKNQDY